MSQKHVLQLIRIHSFIRNVLSLNKFVRWWNDDLHRRDVNVKHNDVFKVIPLKLFYYQTLFETWYNQHS